MDGSEVSGSGLVVDSCGVVVGSEGDGGDVDSGNCVGSSHPNPNTSKNKTIKHKEVIIFISKTSLNNFLF
jgi:hypothetical protein